MNVYKNYTVYCHENKINGKKYFGITGGNPKYRWNNGRGYIHNNYFYRSITKYGWENFNHIILFNGLSKDIACEIESFLIMKYKTHVKDYGYNLTFGGELNLHTEETKRKLSELAKNNKNMLGKTHSKETREILSKANIGKKLSKETINKIRASNSGKRHTEESKRKMSEKAKGRIVSKDTRKIISDRESIPVIQLDNNENSIRKWKSAKEAQIIGGYNCSNITQCCKRSGNYKTCGGFYWMYLSEFLECGFIKTSSKTKKVAQLSESNEIIKIWDNASQISKELNICLNSVSRCVNKKQSYVKENNKKQRFVYLKDIKEKEILI